MLLPVVFSTLPLLYVFYIMVIVECKQVYGWAIFISYGTARQLTLCVAGANLGNSASLLKDS